MKNERQDRIIELLREKRMVKSIEISEQFGVSMETVRRDLEELEAEGILTRVYGGATLRRMYGVEPAYSGRGVKNFLEKQAIAREAAKLVEDGDTLILDVGTTVLELAKNLRDRQGLTVFTNSVPVVLEMVKNQSCRIFILGGEIREGEISSSGFLAEGMIRRFNVDKAFIGIGGISLEKGVCDYHVQEANLRRTFLEQSQMTVGLADYSKIGVKALNHICGIQDLDVLVTDSHADRQFINRMRAQELQVIVAETDA